jgi:dienelactone hydrolase
LQLGQKVSMSRCLRFELFALLILIVHQPAHPQAMGEPDRGQPGDRMIQAYLQRQTEQIHTRFQDDIESLEKWKRLRPKYREEYFEMLGLRPLPAKTPLEPVVTGTYQGNGFVVDMIHYQSRPGLYVTGNLYRPASVEPGQRLPAVLYVCGHAVNGRNGNKTSYQSNGIWFARHGYVCLVLDTLQMGEIAAIHHGTYREQRWWWHSRGYTSAGVECWNGVRGIDYLVSRNDVDPQRIAVTGISGGGAATFWIAAADERVKVAVPVSGMADLPSYVSSRVIKGHCDCMFLHNTYQWPWTRIAALIAPRPLLFVNSDQDRIFPMDANERVIGRLERIYSLYGAGDMVAAVVSIGGHAYREDIRKATFRFINLHLKNDPRVVTDSEVDLVTGPYAKRIFPIAPEQLRVFPHDRDIPTDQLNTTIDEHFVPIASRTGLNEGGFDDWKHNLLGQLREKSFRSLPQRIPPARLLEESEEFVRLETEPGIEIKLRAGEPSGDVKRLLLVVTNPEADAPDADWLQRTREDGDQVYFCDVRGVGATRWTSTNPPNYVERSMVLLGQTVDTGRLWDVVATTRYLDDHHGGKIPIHLLGDGRFGVIGAYAALLEPKIAGVTLSRPPATHMAPGSPQFLNALRVCDIADALGMLAPRPLTLYAPPALYAPQGNFSEEIRAIYGAAAASSQLVIH